jgi:hypothetical protein
MLKVGWNPLLGLGWSPVGVLKQQQVNKAAVYNNDDNQTNHQPAVEHTYPQPNIHKKLAHCTPTLSSRTRMLIMVRESSPKQQKSRRLVDDSD